MNTKCTTAVLTLALILALSAPAQSSTYYMSRSGKDTNSGTSWSQAWLTIDKLNNSMRAGDTVFIGTGIWYNSQIRPPAGGTASDRTVYACSTYTDASRGLARIYGGELLTGWTSIGSNRYTLTCLTSGKTHCVGQDDSLLLEAASAAEVDQPGEFYHDNGSKLLTVQCYGNANPNNHTMVGSLKPAVLFNEANIKHVQFWGLDFKYGQIATVIFEASCDSVFLEHCNISRGSGDYYSNAGAVFFVADGAGGRDYTNPATFGRFNTIRACSLGHCMDEGGWRNSNIVTTYSENHCYVESCMVYPPFGNGVYFKDKMLTPQHTGNVARFNTIVGARQYGVLWTSHALADSAYGNLIYDCNSGICNLGSNSPPFYGGLFIANNTIYDCHTQGMTFTDNEATCGEGNEVKYNVIAGCDISGPMITGFSYPNDANQCFAAYTIDSNMYYNPSDWFDVYAPDHSFSNWRAHGFDVRGANGVNPNFANTSWPDLWAAFSRPSAGAEMDRSDYGGRHWTVWGAVQSAAGCDPPGTPSLTSPTNGATNLDQPILCDWTDVGDADSYQLQIDDNSNFSSPDATYQPVASNQSVSGLAGLTTYYWRVRAYNSCGGWGNFTSSRSFTTAGCDPPATPTLTSPSNGATDLDQPILCNWSDVSGVDFYQIQVDNNSNFSSPEATYQPVSSAQSVSGLAELTTYYWRVRAYNNCGGWGSYSSSRSFTTASAGCDPPAAPTVMSPPNGAANVSQPVPLNWNNVYSATLYQLQVDNSSGFSNPEYNVQLAASQYTLAANLSPSTTYYWHVRSYNACGWGSYSVVMSFTTSAESGGEDTIPPMISNVHATDTTSTTAQILWQTNEPATSQVVYIMGVTAPDSTPMVPILVMDHQTMLTGLYPNTEYEYCVKSADSSDNLAQSQWHLFRTAGFIVSADEDTTVEVVGEPIYYTSQPTLVARNVNDLTDNVYYFEVATDSNFVNMVAASPSVAQQIGSTTGWKVDSHLEENQDYYWRVSANLDQYSTVAKFQVRPKPHSYPDPFRPSETPFVTFTDIPAGAILQVKTLQGETVWTSEGSDNNHITWNGQTDYGKEAAAGVYIWVVEDSDIRGKLTVIR